MEIVYAEWFDKWIHLWCQANKRKEAGAQFRLAALYSSSTDPSMAKKAISLFRQAAKGGMPEADYALGVCYERGYGVRKNAKLAIRCYQAAEGQVWEELFRLPDPAADRINAMMQDVDQASALEEFLQRETAEPSMEELKHLAHQGNAGAQHELAHRYAYGHGVAQDWKLATFWYLRAAHQGYEASMRHLAEYYAEIQEHWKSARWYRQYIEAQLRMLQQRRQQAQDT